MQRLNAYEALYKDFDIASSLQFGDICGKRLAYLHSSPIFCIVLLLVLYLHSLP